MQEAMSTLGHGISALHAVGSFSGTVLRLWNVVLLSSVGANRVAFFG